MVYYPEAIAKLVDAFGHLPGIGPKTAQRLAFHVLSMEEKRVSELAEALMRVKKDLHYCSVCCNVTDQDPCPICEDKSRDRRVVCVVQEPKDVVAIERMREYNGLYHVLHGVISPIEGIGPNDIRLTELLHRLKEPEVQEMILATNPNVEGEATAMYISRLVKPFAINVTRIAHGLPVGGDLEYADEVTLAKALEGRRKL